MRLAIQNVLTLRIGQHEGAEREEHDEPAAVELAEPLDLLVAPVALLVAAGDDADDDRHDDRRDDRAADRPEQRWDVVDVADGLGEQLGQDED